VTTPLVDPPDVRAAGIWEGVDDVAKLRSFRCFAAPGSWYEREALKVLRRATQRLADGNLSDRDRILLCEREDALYGVSVLAAESEKTAHLGFLGLRADLHGARIDSLDGERVTDAFLASCLEVARGLGVQRVTAIVARDHERSRAMLARTGFTVVSRFDRDYDLQALSVE
jgi:L-amino acid N-acyltransferase YncA